jgi:hypothetical protein
MDLLDRYAPSVSGDDGMYTVQFAIVAPTGPLAIDKARALVEKAAAKVGIPGGWDLVECSATRWDVFERHLETPSFPEIVGQAEIMAMLGVSRQRITQLRRDNRRFPRPLAELAGGGVFSKAAIERFMEEWDRTPGPPKRRLPA